MKQRILFSGLSFFVCTCFCLVVSGLNAEPTSDGSPHPDAKVVVIDGKKVLVDPPAKGETAKGDVELSPERLEHLAKKALQDHPVIDDGTPRGDVPGACCDAFSGTCTIRTETACLGVGGLFQGDNTTCSPNNPCPQPIDCDTGAPFTHLGQLPPNPGADPVGSFISDVDAGQLAMEGFLTSGGEITRIRWWGLELNGATNCTRGNNNFNIIFFADAGLLGGGPTNPTPEVVAQFNGITATRLKAQSYAFDGTQLSYSGQLLWEYTVVLPQRVALLNGWVAIQATADGGPCNFRWISHAFGPGNLVHNGQQVDDPNGEIQDVSLCISGNSTPVNGACCDDSVQGGSCTSNVPSNLCTDFGGGDHRFRVDVTCAQLTPACGSITGSCCVGGTCTVETGPQCASLGGSFIAFEDCNPNICIGACCLGTGECQELTLNDCTTQGGQHFGNGSLCSQTACPGTGRCCFDAGASCEIRTEGACNAIGGSRWDEGLTCASPCPIPPTNDQCESAIPITCGETITVDNTVATTDPSDPLFPCRVGGPTQGVNSIWFTFTPTASSATIRTCGSLAPADDSIVQIFDGTCGAFGTPLNCNDDSCGLLSSLCVSNLIVGNTYYIEVAGWAAADIGPYALEVVCPGLTCASTGSCCLTDGGCTVVSEPVCIGQGGTYNGDATVCGETGACCTGVDTCVSSNQACCAAAGGAFLGTGTSCGSEFNDTPALVIPDDPPVSDDQNVPVNGTITDVNLYVDISHTFVGDLFITLSHSGTSVVVWDNQCGGNNDFRVTFDDGAPAVVCAQPTVGTYSPFSPLAPFNGQTAGGTWTLAIDDQAGADTGILNQWTLILEGAGSNPCNTNPGACCFSEGIGDCQLLNAIDCALAGGRYVGPDTVCSGDICVPRGACCDTVTGGCQQLTQEACQALPNGNFLGDFSGCGGCPIVLGSCCNANGTCTPNTQFDPCTAGGGSFTPNGNCDTTGACCFPDTSCVVTTQACCVAVSGAYLGNASNCGDAAGNPMDYSNSPNDPIGAAVATDTINVPDSFTIGDVNVVLDIDHTWIGDMVIDVEHNGTVVQLLNMPGFPLIDPDFGCAADNYQNIVLDDEGTGGPIHDQCVANLTSPPEYTPDEPLSAFDGQDSAGAWNITITDTFPAADNGTLFTWTVQIDGVGINPCDTDPGACCFSEGIGDCQLLNAIDCALAGGRFQGGGSACSGNICVPRGACCNTFDGSCQQLTQEECQALPNSNFLGDFTGCGACPIILGACCLPDTSCVSDVRITQCNQLGGSFLPNTGCGEAAGDPTTYSDSPALAIPDDPPVFDEQNVSDSFPIGDVDLLLNINHTFLGDLFMTLSHSGTSVVVWDNQCGGNNDMQVTFSDGAPAVVCAQPTTGTYSPFSPLAAFNGLNASGTWRIDIDDQAGADTGILNTWSLIIDGIGINPCDTTPGACCFSEGIGDCLLRNAVDCANLGGRFQGSGTACTGDICIPRGACCNTVTGACTQLTQEQCVASPNGNFLGDFTPCSQCPVVTGSCCLANLTCIANSQFASCTGQGGTFNPGGNCTTTGACCLGDGTCNIATQACCLAAGGAYLGDGLNCGEAAGNPTTYSDSPGMAIPDDPAVFDEQNVPDAFTIGDLNLFLDINHTFLGDLFMTLSHNGTSVVVWDNQCGGNDNMQVTFSDGSPAVVCATPTNGTFAPFSPLAPFNGTNAGGTWRLDIDDQAGADIGTLNTWSLIIDGIGINPCDTDPGACCFSETIADCQLLDAVACAAAGGRFQGGGTSCTGTICEIRGACCSPTTGACEQLTQVACTGQGGNWLGGFTSCAQCPIVLGACCLPGGGCQANTQFNPCTGLGGAFLPNQNCGDSAGNPITFVASPALAIPDNAAAGVLDVINVPDSFAVGDVNVSLNVTHTFVGDLCVTLEHSGTTVAMIQRMGAVVAGTPCHLGTPFGCGQDNFNNIILDDEGTLPIETQCVLNLTSPPNYTPNNPLSAFDGQNSSGAWTLNVSDNGAADLGTLNSWSLILDGQGVNPCNVTPGACCVGQLDTDCSIQTLADCLAASGRYQGPSTSCTPGICIIRGACCNTLNGTCTETTQAACVGANTSYQGNFTTCATANCPQATGACCLQSGVCQNGRTLAQCNTSGGNWSGANSTCETATGACCLGGGACMLSTQSCCVGLGGSYAGPGTNCGGPTGNPNTYTQSVNATIPNNNPAGLTRTFSVPDSFPIADVDISVNVTIVGVGQITVNVTHNGVTRSIIQRIGAPAISAFGCLQNNLNVRLDDEGTGGPIENACSGGFGTLFPTSPPNFIPNQTLDAFDTMDASGNWTIQVIDADAGGTGQLVSWSVHIDGFGGGACSSTEECTTCPGDTNGDDALNGKDVDSFGDCIIAGGTGCPCGDMNSDTNVTMADVPGFVQALLQGTGPCGQAQVCTTCLGDASGDSSINGRDCAALVNCILNTPNGCPCVDMDSNGAVNTLDIPEFVTRMLSQTGSCP